MCIRDSGVRQQGIVFQFFPERFQKHGRHGDGVPAACCEAKEPLRGLGEDLTAVIDVDAMSFM